MYPRQHRPSIKIEPTPTDLLLQLVGLLACIVMVMLPLYYYGDLPETIPTKFDTGGNATSYSSKATIFVLSGIGIFSYVGMHVLAKYPRLYNYMVEITDDNAYDQYRLGVWLIRLLASFTAVTFAIASWGIIHAARHGTAAGMAALGPGLGVGITGILGWYIYQSNKMK